MASWLPTLQTLISSRFLAQVSNLLLWMGVFWYLGFLVSSQLEVVSSPQFPKIVVESKSPSSVAGRASLLFGEPDLAAVESSAPVASLNPSDVDKTRLSLKLIGAIVTDGQGVAIIEQSGTTHIVGEGDEITRGVELIKVFSDQVIILHRGKREKLLMEEADAGLISEVKGFALLASGGAKLSGGKGKSLQKIGEELKKQPVSISKYIRFQPINEGGKWTAVKIWPRSERALFKRIGFQAGDLIKSINGRSIQEMSQEPALWQRYLNKSQFDLTLERRGQPVKLSVNLN